MNKHDRPFTLFDEDNANEERKMINKFMEVYERFQEGITSREDLIFQFITLFEYNPLIAVLMTFEERQTVDTLLRFEEIIEWSKNKSSNQSMLDEIESYIANLIDEQKIGIIILRLEVLQQDNGIYYEKLPFIIADMLHLSTDAIRNCLARLVTVENGMYWLQIWMNDQSMQNTTRQILLARIQDEAIVDEMMQRLSVLIQ